MSSVPAELRRRLKNAVDELPVLPHALVKLLGLQPSDDDYFEQLVDVISSEPSMAVRALVFANSSASAPTDKISRLPIAVARMGARNTANFILTGSVQSVFAPQNDWELGLWKHAQHVAVCTRELTRLSPSVTVEPGVAYAGGLLHDIGRFVLFKLAPDALRKVDETTWGSMDELLEAERVICGVTHDVLGARACERWGLPPLLTNLVRHHHHPNAPDVAPNMKRFLELLSFADLTMAPMSAGNVEEQGLSVDDFATLAHAKAPEWLGLNETQLATVISAAIEAAP